MCCIITADHFQWTPEGTQPGKTCSISRPLVPPTPRAWPFMLSWTPGHAWLWPPDDRAKACLIRYAFCVVRDGTLLKRGTMLVITKPFLRFSPSLCLSICVHVSGMAEVRHLIARGGIAPPTRETGTGRGSTDIKTTIALAPTLTGGRRRGAVNT